MKEYLKNFESLCTGNAYIYSQPKFKNFRQSIDKTNYFDALKEFDKTFSGDVADVLNLIYMRILEQPYWYIEAVELYPNDIDKQGQYLYDNIELAKDRLFGIFRGVDRITDQLDKLARNDRPSAQRLFEEILYITNELLKPKNIGCLSFEILSFNLKESPLFVVFMEFIEDKKNRAGNPYYSEIDNYLTNFESYKKRFKLENPIPLNKEESTQPTGITIDAVISNMFPSIANFEFEQLKKNFSGEKKPITLEHAFVMARAKFINFDLKAIQSRLELAPDENEKILKENRNIAVSIFQDNIFVDQNVIFEIDYIKGLIETWNEILSFGKDYPFIDRVPKGFIEHPFNFVFNTLCEARRQKFIIDYCNGELIPKNSTQPTGKKHPDKYYALLHLVNISLGKEPQIGSKTKREKIELGRSKYQTGQGFYRQINDIDLLNMVSFVKSLPLKNRNNWKEIIKEISGNDADVISWLKKQPN